MEKKRRKVKKGSKEKNLENFVNEKFQKKRRRKEGEKIFQKKRDNEKNCRKLRKQQGVNNRVYIREGNKRKRNRRERARKGVKKRGERERGNKREG